ncbi:hypothetical protein Acr_00g0005940 [Actinidia rufa]|uniref:Uncharacterized protein n=1 Tax=Actinidia rufa TaxID=165716 RepID=A0A7J0D7W4_9ERIC|nr:hypothetical protein Acr_00g0005940 [Actinidia rufa]
MALTRKVFVCNGDYSQLQHRGSLSSLCGNGLVDTAALARPVSNSIRIELCCGSSSGVPVLTGSGYVIGLELSLSLVIPSVTLAKNTKEKLSRLVGQGSELSPSSAIPSMTLTKNTNEKLSGFSWEPAFDSANHLLTLTECTLARLVGQGSELSLSSVIPSVNLAKNTKEKLSSVIGCTSVGTWHGRMAPRVCSLMNS